MVQSDLMAAIERYRAAEAACSSYDEETHQVALAAFSAATSQVPHHQTTASFINMNSERVSLSTSGVGTIATARRVLQDVKDGHIFNKSFTDDDAEYLATIREVVIAADKREIEMSRLRTEHRVDEMESHADALAVAAGDALNAAIEAPVRGLAELLVKAELIQETENWERMGDDLLADIRRLAGDPASIDDGVLCSPDAGRA